MDSSDRLKQEKKRAREQFLRSAPASSSSFGKSALIHKGKSEEKEARGKGGASSVLFPVTLRSVMGKRKEAQKRAPGHHLPPLVIEREREREKQGGWAGLRFAALFFHLRSGLHFRR